MGLKEEKRLAEAIAFFPYQEGFNGNDYNVAEQLKMHFSLTSKHLKSISHNGVEYKYLWMRSQALNKKVIFTFNCNKKTFSLYLEHNSNYYQFCRKYGENEAEVEMVEMGRFLGKAMVLAVEHFLKGNLIAIEALVKKINIEQDRLLQNIENDVFSIV